jgi:hypothetical protein
MATFFDEYAPYRAFVDGGQFSYSIEAGLRLLGGVKELAPEQYKAAHKGTPFYIMGYAAFASHDYPGASPFFDAAVAADLQYHKGRLDSPALQFIQLLADKDQPVLAHEIVQLIKASTEQLLDDYGSRAGAKPITLDEFRCRFFRRVLLSGQAHQRTLLTTFISFVAEWRHRAKLLELIEEGSREPFFLHLFRGCLLFESLLKGAASSISLTTLGRSLIHHQSALGITNIETSESDFNEILKTLIPKMDIEATINSCSKTRNTLGHNLVWMTADLTAQNYDLLVKNIAASCLHAIAALYP